MWLDGPVAGPHDSIVKSFFANTEAAAPALASALPKAIAERIDWSSLRHANVNLVDRKLREFFSDIVFTARIQDREVILYVLLEHQSTNDPLMRCACSWSIFPSPPMLTPTTSMSLPSRLDPLLRRPT